MGRVTGGDLVIELKQDVMDLRRSFHEMEQRMQTAVNDMQTAINSLQTGVKTLGDVVRVGFSGVEKSLDRFAVHLDAQTDALGELTAKVNDHEDRLTALEARET